MFQNGPVQGISKFLGKSYKELSVCPSQVKHWHGKDDQALVTFSGRPPTFKSWLGLFGKVI